MGAYEPSCGRIIREEDFRDALPAAYAPIVEYLRKHHVSGYGNFPGRKHGGHRAKINNMLNEGYLKRRRCECGHGFMYEVGDRISGDQNAGHS